MKSRCNRIILSFISLFGIIFTAQSVFAASGMFPKMPAATNAYVVNIHKDSGDAWMTAWALQGMINQKFAEVYLINNPWDWGPLKECGKPYKKLPRLKGTNAGLRTLFKKYQNRVKKMFVYDPNKDWTWYLALMSGAQQQGIPVTETIKNELISEFGWKGEVEDFRNRWANRIDAYNWALIHLMPHCTKKVIFATSNRRDKYRERIGNPITDYAVASKGFVFWLNFDKPDELTEIRKIFSTLGYGVGTSLMGYASDGDAANEIANRYGIGYVVSELYANGSFWSSFPDKTYTQSPRKAVKAEPGKVYASIIWSDGDNLEMDQNPIYKFWHDPARGTVPVGTELAPALQELNSPLLDWYYSHMTTNDELIAGPTGVQYIFIQYFNDRLFPAWCRLTREWCQDAGFHTGHIWLAPIPSVKYSEYMTMCGFDGVLTEGFHVKSGFPPETDSWGADNEEDLFKQITKIKPDPKKPIFTGFTCIVQGFYKPGNNSYSAIKRVVDRVNAEYPGRYVFLLPKDKFATIRAYYNSTNMQKVIGIPGSDTGLIPVHNGDGQFTTTEREGRRCWLVPKGKSPNYFYLKVPDAFRPKPGQTLEIDLAYFDSGSGDIALDYDSTDITLPLGGAYERYPYTVHRMNSGQWKLARFYVNDAGFGQSENGGADFRFDNEGTDLLISGVQVQRVNR
jgi:GxGYxYP putative glycoside hydrolase C-terminal domain/GxGYxYP_N second domain/GxGYxYP third domain/GxGYxYP_N 1st domain